MSNFLAEKFGDVAGDIKAMQIRLGPRNNPQNHLINVHMPDGNTVCLKDVSLACIVACNKEVMQNVALISR